MELHVPETHLSTVPKGVSLGLKRRDGHVNVDFDVETATSR